MIIDIRQPNTLEDLSTLILNGLQLKNKTLPTLLLYDHKGLQLFEKITYLKEYYFQINTYSHRFGR